MRLPHKIYCRKRSPALKPFRKSTMTGQIVFSWTGLERILSSRTWLFQVLPTTGYSKSENASISLFLWSNNLLNIPFWLFSRSPVPKRRLVCLGWSSWTDKTPRRCKHLSIWQPSSIFRWFAVNLPLNAWAILLTWYWIMSHTLSLHTSL